MVGVTRAVISVTYECNLTYMGSATGWDGWDMSHPIFLLFNTTPMGVAWKESTPEGLRPPQYLEAGRAPANLTKPNMT